MAPAMVLADDETPTTGWLVESNLEVVDAGNPNARRLLLPGAGQSKVKIHVRVTDVKGAHRGHDVLAESRTESQREEVAIQRREQRFEAFEVGGGVRLVEDVQVFAEQTIELARADRATLILITHDMTLAGRCDRILRIADGLLVGDERTPHALAAQ